MDNARCACSVYKPHRDFGAAPDEALEPASILQPEPQLQPTSRIPSHGRYIEKDKALERRFQQVLVEPPSVDETVSILRGLRERYATVSCEC
jgi:ATP-dependent Clp protease ATP-binding subunit ClpB